MESDKLAQMMARELIKASADVTGCRLDVEEGQLVLHYNDKQYRLGPQWTSPTHLYESHVAGEMLRQGYLVFEIPGGWLVISPAGEEYQLETQSCSCADFVINKRSGARCKHLVLRDWWCFYRQRIAEYNARTST